MSVKTTAPAASQPAQTQPAQTQAATSQAQAAAPSVPTTMQAYVREVYGGPEVLALREVPVPTPQPDEVLIRVQATALNAADWHLLLGDPALTRLMYGLRTPKYKVLGADVAGTVVAAGSAVTQFAGGDAVFGDLSACGFGGLAEYAVARPDLLARLPAGLSFAEAAALPMAAMTALQGLRTVGQIKAGDKVLIHGASGGVGSYAVQIAVALGAEVTAVCSTRNVEQARALGADHVIDYTQEDFAASGQRYDLILAANGNRSLADYKRALAPGGRYVMAGGSNRQMFQALALAPFYSLTGGVKLDNVMAQGNGQDLAFIGELVEAGKLRPVIDRRFEFDEVPDAMRYLVAGHARGKVVIG